MYPKEIPSCLISRLLNFTRKLEILVTSLYFPNKKQFTNNIMLASFHSQKCKIIIITRSNQGLISAFEHWSWVDNTCHIHFSVDRIMHFLYATEAVNKSLINVLDLFKKCCIYCGGHDVFTVVEPT